MQEQWTRLHSMDNLELLSIHNQAQAFPEHYHESFCISFIRCGLETIKMANESIFCPANAISLTNPFEIHANPIESGNQHLSFDTLYLSQDIVDHYLGRKKSSFHQRVYTNAQVLAAFEDIKRGMKEADSRQTLGNSLPYFLQLLLQSDKLHPGKDTVQKDAKWSELILYIDQQLKHKLSLEILADFVHMDKYHFSRSFRRKFGMSPINYVLMKKVFAAKKQIRKESELVGIAYDFAFADQAHFSKTFKKFIGLSPNSYKKSLLKN